MCAPDAKVDMPEHMPDYGRGPASRHPSLGPRLQSDRAISGSDSRQARRARLQRHPQPRAYRASKLVRCSRTMTRRYVPGRAGRWDRYVAGGSCGDGSERTAASDAATQCWMLAAATVPSRQAAPGAPSERNASLAQPIGRLMEVSRYLLGTSIRCRDRGNLHNRKCVCDARSCFSPRPCLSDKPVNQMDVLRGILSGLDEQPRTLLLMRISIHFGDPEQRSEKAHCCRPVDAVGYFFPVNCSLFPFNSE